MDAGVEAAAVTGGGGGGQEPGSGCELSQEVEQAAVHLSKGLPSGWVERAWTKDELKWFDQLAA